MKKLLLLTTLLFAFVVTFSQDVVVIKHTNYTTHFSKSKKYPVMVEWWETKAKIGCEKPLARVDKFAPDPQLPAETNLAADYVGSGFDRGHMMPAKSNQCQTPEVQNDAAIKFRIIACKLDEIPDGEAKNENEVLELLKQEMKSFLITCYHLYIEHKIGRAHV